MTNREIFTAILLVTSQNQGAQSAGIVEYTDCISTDG